MPRHAPAHARHTCGVPWHLMNRCTKCGAKDLFTLECWHGAVTGHLNESSNVFVSFGRVISQNFFRNYTFEIIDLLSNGSSRPQLNRMLEFSLIVRPLISAPKYLVIAALTNQIPLRIKWLYSPIGPNIYLTAHSRYIITFIRDLHLPVIKNKGKFS